MALFWLARSEAIEDASDQLEGSCWPIAPTADWATAPTTDCAAPCGAPANWLNAPTMLDSPEPPRRPLSKFRALAKRADVAAADGAGEFA